MRNEAIDNAKGIGILLVLLGHSITLMDNPVNTIILSFHMPLFFMLSGAVLRTHSSFVVWIKRRFLTLGIALLTGAFLNVLAWLISDVLIERRISVLEFWTEHSLAGLFNNWFIITLFLADCTCNILLRMGVVAGVFGGGDSISRVLVDTRRK